MSRLPRVLRRGADLEGERPRNGSMPSNRTGEPELRSQRDRLMEKFTIMQTDLGGAFYEMAIRDHIRLDVLTRKAAELQKVDAELEGLERRLELERQDAAGICPSCRSPYGHGTRFCSQCGTALSTAAGST